MSTSLYSVIGPLLTRTSKALVRDYGEIETLQSSFTKAQAFFAHTQKRLLNNLVYALAKVYPQAGYGFRGAPMGLLGDAPRPELFKKAPHKSKTPKTTFFQGEHPGGESDRARKTLGFDGMISGNAPLENASLQGQSGTLEQGASGHIPAPQRMLSLEQEVMQGAIQAEQRALEGQDQEKPPFDALKNPGGLWEICPSKPAEDMGEKWHTSWTKPLWMLWEIEGKENFVRGIPQCSVILTLQENGVTKATFVYDPLRYEMFWAQKGCGTFLNNHRIRTRPSNVTGRALYLGFHGQSPFSANDMTMLERFSLSGHKVRISGTPTLDLAYVSAGRYDGAWASFPTQESALSGALLVQEAGGFVRPQVMGSDVYYLAGGERFVSQSSSS